MMFKILLPLLLVSFSFNNTTFAASTSLDKEAQALQSTMKGHWKSISCELRPQKGTNGQAVQSSWVTRDFTFDGTGKFKATIITYVDQFCEQPMNEFNFSGHTKIGDINRAAAGARDITYILDETLSITPRSPIVVDMMTKLPPKACGDEPYQLNVAQSIFKKPCVLLNNIDSGQVVKDYDLIYLHDNNLLFMGAKHVDGSGFYKPENRPKSGLQVPMIRVD